MWQFCIENEQYSGIGVWLGPLDIWIPCPLILPGSWTPSWTDGPRPVAAYGSLWYGSH